MLQLFVRLFVSISWAALPHVVLRVLPALGKTWAATSYLAMFPWSMSLRVEIMLFAIDEVVGNKKSVSWEIKSSASRNIESIWSSQCWYWLLLSCRAEEIDMEMKGSFTAVLAQ